MDDSAANLILYRLDQQDEKLEAIEAHTSATNGRVRKLEIFRAEVQGARRLGSGIAGYIAPVLTGVTTALIVWIATGTPGA